MVTSASRLMNYRVTSRNGFLNNIDTTRNDRTLLVPVSSATLDDRLRMTQQSGFNRTRGAFTARTDEEDEEANVNLPNLAMQSNGFSAAGAPQNASIAKYKMVRDGYTVGDKRLLDQESTNYRNIEYLFFFFAIILVLCICTAVACYVSFIMTNSAALCVFIILILGVPLDMLLFRLIL